MMTEQVQTTPTLDPLTDMVNQLLNKVHSGPDLVELKHELAEKQRDNFMVKIDDIVRMRSEGAAFADIAAKHGIATRVAGAIIEMYGDPLQLSELAVIGIEREHIAILKRLGVTSAQALTKMSVNDLANMDGIGKVEAKRIGGIIKSLRS